MKPWQRYTTVRRWVTRWYLVSCPRGKVVRIPSASCSAVWPSQKFDSATTTRLVVRFFVAQVTTAPRNESTLLILVAWSDMNLRLSNWNDQLKLQLEIDHTAIMWLDWLLRCDSYLDIAHCTKWCNAHEALLIFCNFRKSYSLHANGMLCSN